MASSHAGMAFAPNSVGTYQDSDGGEGRQCPSPLFNGNSSGSNLVPGTVGSGRFWGAFIGRHSAKKRRQELLARTPSGVERRARVC